MKEQINEQERREGLNESEQGTVSPQVTQSLIQKTTISYSFSQQSISPQVFIELYFISGTTGDTHSSEHKAPGACLNDLRI